MYGRKGHIISNGREFIILDQREHRLYVSFDANRHAWVSEDDTIIYAEVKA